MVIKTQRNNENKEWDPFFYRNFKGFESIEPLWKHFSAHFSQWPTIEDFNTFSQHWYALKKIDEKEQVTFIEQTNNMCYESTVLSTHTIPTRLRNWHDFLNNLTWLCYPKTKWALFHKRRYISGNDTSHRTPLQNLLAHVDECGMVLCSTQTALFEAVKNLQWKKVFWKNASLLTHSWPLIMGHGLLEKSLSPYVGMTGKAIFLEVDLTFFSFSLEEKINYVDEKLALYILSEAFPDSPNALHPFPVLGWPDWHAKNKEENFYENVDYFRTSRRGLRLAEIPCAFIRYQSK